MKYTLVNVELETAGIVNSQLRGLFQKVGVEVDNNSYQGMETDPDNDNPYVKVSGVPEHKKEILVWEIENFFPADMLVKVVFVLEN